MLLCSLVNISNSFLISCLLQFIALMFLNAYVHACMCFIFLPPHIQELPTLVLSFFLFLIIKFIFNGVSTSLENTESFFTFYCDVVDGNILRCAWFKFRSPSQESLSLWSSPYLNSLLWGQVKTLYMNKNFASIFWIISEFSLGIYRPLWSISFFLMTLLWLPSEIICFWLRNPQILFCFLFFKMLVPTQINTCTVRAFLRHINDWLDSHGT